MHDYDLPMLISTVPLLLGGPNFEVVVASEVFGIPRYNLISSAYVPQLCREDPGGRRTRSGIFPNSPDGLGEVVSTSTVVGPVLCHQGHEPCQQLLDEPHVGATLKLRVNVHE
jgi:hypothetical protein